MRRILLQLACGVSIFDIIRRAWDRPHDPRMRLTLKDMDRFMKKARKAK